MKKVMAMAFTILTLAACGKKVTITDPNAAATTEAERVAAESAENTLICNEATAQLGTPFYYPASACSTTHSCTPVVVTNTDGQKWICYEP